MDVGSRKIVAHVGRLFISKNRSGNMDFMPIEGKGSQLVLKGKNGAGCSYLQ